MYIIKQIPEDFMVWEIPDYELVEDGLYAYFWLKKTNYNTLDAIKKISEKLNIPLKNIGFAGIKDKMAVTEQVISIRAIKKEKISRLKLKDIELTYIGQGEKPISLGDLKANRFRITVRNLNITRINTKLFDKIPNYFGPQRFSKNNIEIGKALVKRNFKKAIDLIDNRSVKSYLEDHPGDYVGALRKLPLRLRRLYIHAYQSYIWNLTVREYMKTMPNKDINIPIVGFQTELKNDDIGKIISKILFKENITSREFIIQQIPEISSEGGTRNLFTRPTNIEIEMKNDDINKNKKIAIITFTLIKSSYATVVIDHLFNPKIIPL